MKENAGVKIGMIKVRLFRPWSIELLLRALPKTVKAIAVLEKTKECGASDPMYLDVLSAFENTPGAPFVVGGRYGLGGKEFTPACVRAVYDNLSALPQAEEPLHCGDKRRHHSPQPGNWPGASRGSSRHQQSSACSSAWERTGLSARTMTRYASLETTPTSTCRDTSSTTPVCINPSVSLYFSLSLSLSGTRHSRHSHTRAHIKRQVWRTHGEPPEVREGEDQVGVPYIPGGLRGLPPGGVREEVRHGEVREAQRDLRFELPLD